LLQCASTVLSDYLQRNTQSVETLFGSGHQIAKSLEHAYSREESMKDSTLNETQLESQPIQRQPYARPELQYLGDMKKMIAQGLPVTSQ
jgi:hypothetical protein